MTYSPEWDAVYSDGRERIIWPWSDVVSLATRFGAPLRGKRVLELGCGIGANVLFFTYNGCAYHGVDGSGIALSKISRAKVEVADFTKSLPFGDMDIIFDRAAVAHNDTSGIRSCVELAYDALKSGGIYIGVDWFSHQHDEYARGEPDTDEFTKTDYADGQFSGVGRVHFSDEGHLRDIFCKFEFLHLEEKVRRDVLAGAKAATWNLVVKKRD